MRKFSNLPLAARISIIVAVVLVVCFLVVAGIYWYIGSLILSRQYQPDIIVTSPDGRHELVIREFSCLGGAGAELYIRKTGQDKWYNSWLEKQIGNAGTDDYYQTFSAGTYYVEWKNDHITLYYYTGLLIEDVNDRSTWRGIVSYDLE